MLLSNQEISGCGVSGDSDLVTVFSLPRLPLTEAFGTYDRDFAAYNQELVVSLESGHVQLRHQLDPTALYSTDNYEFRSGNESKSMKELKLLQSFISTCLKARPLGHVLEIGGNDLSLATLLLSHSKSYTACDPLLRLNDGSEIDGISIVGTMVEEAIATDRFRRTELLIARHTLEHIANPRVTIQALMEASSDECLFVFEVPSLEHLVEAQRFDAVFHQHYHYFDLNSVRRLIWEVGGEYVGHEYNYQGSNGGSLMFAFRRGQRDSLPPSVDVAGKVAWLKQRIMLFNQQMEITGLLLDQLTGPIYGFGAAHMLATLDYHLGNRVKNLACILDDDTDKEGFSYLNVDVNVRSTSVFLLPNRVTT